MRKLLLPAVVLVALVIACENKSPTGPAGVGPGGVTVTQTTSSTTTTTSIPPTTTTSSTTTSSTTTTVVGSGSRRYVAFQPPNNIPADMTLFFHLLTGPGLVESFIERLPLLGDGPRPAAENEYSVTGVYTMQNGTTGTVNGELGGSSNPLETGGHFMGRLTAKVGDCTAEREFSGPLGPQSLTWTGMGMIRDCPGSPLSVFSQFTLLRWDAPLPSTTSTSTTTTTVPTTTTTTTTTTTVPATTTTVPTTTTSVPTTTTSVPTTTTSVPTTTSTSTSTTTTTTSAVTCTYSLSPTSGSVAAAGGSSGVVIGTLAPCAWTAQSFASWLTVDTASGTGPASVTWTATANVNGPARTGTLVIAGNTFTVTQAAPDPADMVAAMPTTYCAGAAGAQTATVYIRNQGNGPAVASVARITYTNGGATANQNVSALAAGAQATLTFSLPSGCFGDGVCPFSIAADATGLVYELNEGNNSTTGSCQVLVIGGPSISR